MRHLVAAGNSESLESKIWAKPEIFGDGVCTGDESLFDCLLGEKSVFKVWWCKAGSGGEGSRSRSLTVGVGLGRLKINLSSTGRPSLSVRVVLAAEESVFSNWRALKDEGQRKVQSHLSP